ncbi:MAG: EAL domain-containing protein [Sedimenticola sp.]
MNLRNLGIFPRLLLSVALLGMGVALVSGFAHYRFSADLIQKSVETRIQTALQDSATYFETRYRLPIENQLRLLASSPAVHEVVTAFQSELVINRPEVESLFRSVISANQDLYEALFLLDSEGNERIIIKGKKRIRNYLNVLQAEGNDTQRHMAHLFRRISKSTPGTIHYDHPFPRIQQLGYTLLVGIVLRDPDIGGFGGVLIAEMSLDDFMDYLTGITVFEHSLTWLYDYENRPILKPEEGKTQLDPTDFLFNGHSLPEGALIHHREIFAGNEKNQLFKLAFSMPPEILSVHLDGAERILLYILAFVILISIFIAYLMATRIARPINALTRMASAVGEGSLDVREKEDWGGEMGTLARTFNSMVQDLRQSTVSKSYMDNIIRSMSDALIVTDNELKIKRVNLALTELLRTDEHVLLGQHLDQIIDKHSDRNTVREAVNSGNTLLGFETVYRTANGQKVPVALSLTQLHGNNNANPEGYVCVAQDITVRRESEEALRDSEKRFRDLIESSSDSVWEVDQNAVYTFVSDKVHSLLGYEAREILGKTPFDLMPQKEAERIRLQFASIASAQEPFRSLININLHKDGHQVVLETSGVPVFSNEGIFLGYRGIDRDITSEKEAEERLAEERKVLATVDRTLTRFIEHHDSGKGFEAVLDDLLTLTESQYGFIGECSMEDDGTPYMQAIAISNIAWDDDTRQFYDEYAPTGFKFYKLDGLHTAAIATGETIIANDPPNHPNSKGVPAGHPSLNTFLGIPLQRGEKIIGTVGIANRESGYDEAMVERLMPFWSALAEIIEARQIDMAREASQQETERLAHYDVLTGLPNRALFHERLDWAVKQVRRYDQSLALLLLDLDHFKDVNDTLGHSAGDSLLIAVAERLNASVRESDVVARLGGDEFAIVLMGLEHTDAAATFARRICEIIGEPFDIDGNQIHTGTSIGISVCSSDLASTDQLLTHADTALYRVKAESRGGFRFHDPEMESQFRQRVKIIEDLHKAISEKQFCLFFQPQINIAEQRLAGCESLIRWNHPEHGLVLPNVFVPIAEESGQLLVIDDWVLNESCRQLRSWQDRGLMMDATVAVNLSPLQFKTAEFEDRVIVALEASKLDPHHLELEVTERTLAERPEEVAEVMLRLNKLGVKFSIDDFGTGYSSLQYLKSLPVSKIKIAHEFVWEMLKDSNDAAIVDAIIGLGQDFGHQIIAEGVETSEQLGYLRGKGCPLIQGYYFSKPEPPDRFEKWMREELPSFLS